MPRSTRGDDVGGGAGASWRIVAFLVSVALATPTSTRCSSRSLAATNPVASIL